MSSSTCSNPLLSILHSPASWPHPAEGGVGSETWGSDSLGTGRSHHRQHSAFTAEKATTKPEKPDPSSSSGGDDTRDDEDTENGMSAQLDEAQKIAEKVNEDMKVLRSQASQNNSSQVDAQDQLSISEAR